MIYMCECGHALWEHGGYYIGKGNCRNRKETTIAHPTDKNVKPIQMRGCNCIGFKPGLTLKEYMDKAHAA